MQRILISSLLLSALSLPVWADPLALTPDLSNAGGAQSAPNEVAPPAVSPPAPLRVAAAQSNLGGGFIEFLFGGVEQGASVPRAHGAAPEHSERAPPLRGALADEPAYAAVETVDDGHPPIDPKFDRQVVDYDTREPPGTIVVDTPHKFLYLVEDGGKALRYGIGVGRPGFTWAGVKTITAKREWPDWRPPEAMLKRQPELPRFMAGGPQNPLGARAMYLGSSEYRIHGSNEPWTIGHNVSSGCIRLRNADVMDLYNRVNIGTKVVVM